MWIVGAMLTLVIGMLIITLDFDVYAGIVNIITLINEPVLYKLACAYSEDSNQSDPWLPIVPPWRTQIRLHRFAVDKCY